MGVGKLAYWVFAVAVLFNLAILFNPGSPGDPGTFIPHRDKIVHFLSFASVAWAGRRAGFAPILLGAALVAHAVESELLQHFLLPSRSGDPFDVLADVCGVAAGLAVAAWFASRTGVRRGSTVAGS